MGVGKREKKRRSRERAIFRLGRVWEWNIVLYESGWGKKLGAPSWRTGDCGPGEESESGGSAVTVVGVQVQTGQGQSGTGYESAGGRNAMYLLLLLFSGTRSPPLCGQLGWEPRRDDVRIITIP